MLRNRERVRGSSEGRRPVGALLQLVPLWMLTSSVMSKLVFMILLLHSTFVWVRSVLLLAGSSLYIYTECRRLLREFRHSQATVVISSVDMVSRLRVIFVCLISHGL